MPPVGGAPLLRERSGGLLADDTIDVLSVRITSGWARTVRGRREIDTRRSAPS